jgi:glycosyltransferase involved in cell wall biosynthesis
MSPIVSVIVPVFNDQKSLTVLLRTLANQDLPREQFECLIIDNGSAEPVRIPPDCPLEVRVLREGEPGSYAARNRGLSEARGDIVAFTDADCIPRGDWLSSAVRQIHVAKEPVMVAGHVEVACDVKQGSVSWWRRIFQWHSVANDLNQQRFVSRYHFAATANLITTRDVFERTGPFNTSLFSGGDVEWGQRAWSRGIRQIYAEDVVVVHPARADWRSLVAKTRRIAGGHYVLHSRTGRPLLKTVAMTLNIAAASLRRSWLDPRLPTVGCRVGVAVVELALRLIQLGEIVRLGLGGRARNC